MKIPGRKRFMPKVFELGTTLSYRFGVLFSSRKTWLKNESLSDADGDQANLGKSYFWVMDSSPLPAPLDIVFCSVLVLKSVGCLERRHPTVKNQSNIFFGYEKEMIEMIVIVGRHTLDRNQISTHLSKPTYHCVK